MRRKILVDPWIFEGAFERDDPTRLELISRFVHEVTRDGASEPLPVLDQSFHNRFHLPLAQGGASRGARRILQRWLGAIVRDAPGTGIATVDPMPMDVGNAWKESLFEASAADECESWRSATLVCPTQRISVWPLAPTTAIEGLSGPAVRVSAKLQHLDAHPEYRHDVNPWLFRACADKEVEKQTSSFKHPCRLPVPPELLESGKHQDEPNVLAYPISAWTARLAVARSAGWLRPTHGYYIPPEFWSPATINRIDWRRRSAFPSDAKDTGKGKKTGPVDFLGQVWWWDVEEHHWDVQDADPTKHNKWLTVMETGARR